MMIYNLSISRFKWNTLKLPEDFNIVPMTGYCSPGMDVNFVVSFQPTRHDNLIEGNVSVYNFYPMHKYSIFERFSYLLPAICQTKKWLITQHISRLIFTFYVVFNFPK